MFAPLILSVLLPLNPALFLRELVSWFIGCLARTLADEETRAWIKANPKDRSVRLDLLGSLIMIEDMIAALTHIRARQMLGHTPKRRRRKGRRPSYALTGHAPSLEEIERRFERALQRLDAVERHSAHLVVKLARLLTNAVSQLQRPPHPAGPSSTTTTIFRRVRQKSSAASPRAGQRIRAPPLIRLPSETKICDLPATPAGTRPLARNRDPRHALGKECSSQNGFAR